MNKRIAVIFLSVALLFITSCESSNTQLEKTITLSLPELVYTKHARCRMECRLINEAEVREIIAANHTNEQKSNSNDKPCPTIAYEGYSRQSQHLRIVVAQCDKIWKVVTCIDLDNEHVCSCP